MANVDIHNLSRGPKKIRIFRFRRHSCGAKAGRLLLRLCCAERRCLLPLERGARQARLLPLINLNDRTVRQTRITAVSREVRQTAGARQTAEIRQKDGSTKLWQTGNGPSRGSTRQSIVHGNYGRFYRALRNPELDMAPILKDWLSAQSVRAACRRNLAVICASRSAQFASTPLRDLRLRKKKAIRAAAPSRRGRSRETADRSASRGTSRYPSSAGSATKP